MHISASDPALCNLAIFAQPHEKVSEGVCKVHLKLFKFDCMSLREAAARVYDTDLSDDAWSLIEPMLPVPRFGCRPRTTNVRAVLNAIFYLLRTGCQWRLLPREFPVWGTVYHYFRSWDNAGVWTYVQRTLYEMTRIQAGRSACPSVVIMDSQSVKTTERGGVRGFDAHKRVKGRKRHILVDTSGLLIACRTAPADRGSSHIQPKTSVKDFDLASFSGKPRLNALLLAR